MSRQIVSMEHALPFHRNASVPSRDTGFSVGRGSTTNRLEYPFATHEQDARKLALMSEFTTGYLRRHRIFSNDELYADTVVQLARFRTPNGTSDEGLSSACMYMAWVLFLDDVSDGGLGDVGPATVSRYCDIVRSIRDGAPDLEPATPAEGALVELASVVRGISARHGLGVDEFCERTIAMMRARQWERHHSTSSSQSFSRSDYSHIRPAAVANGAFVSIMKLDRGILVDRFDPLTKARAILLDELTTRLVYVSNDILSEHRQGRDSSALSLVRLIAEETGIPWSQAVERAISCHDQDVDSYRRVREELLSGCRDAEVVRLVEILDTNIAGDVVATEWIRSRYLASADEARRL